MIDKNFFTYKILENKKNEILTKFPELNNCGHDNFYSLGEYIYDSPSKFYERDIFDSTQEFLNELLNNSKDIISFLNVLNQFSFEFDHAIKTLNTINQKAIHENLLPDDDTGNMFFLSEKIIYEYLKLNDVVLLGFLKPIAHFLRLKHNKGTDKLDIYNCIETLKSHKIFEQITKKYDNTIRNAIAHGGVTFESSKIKFRDKKSSKEFFAGGFLKEFDYLVDSVNAIAFAYKKIFFQYLDVFNKYNISIPHSVLEIELRAASNHYGWEIMHSYDSETHHGFQYNLLIHTNLNSRKFMNFSAAYTAITLEKLLPNKYSNVFFHIKTKYTIACWQTIDLKKLREFYAGKKVIITDGTMFFEEKFMAEKKDQFKIHKHFFKQNIPIKKKSVQVRYIKHHHKKNYNVIENAGVFLDIETTDRKEIEDFVRKNTKKIITLVKSEKRKNFNSSYKERFFPDKYLQVYIYDRDFRKRTFHRDRKHDNFIGMLHINNTKQIKNIVPAFGVKEDNAHCLIVWNRKN
mgnify:CR=1 FL=1